MIKKITKIVSDGENIVIVKSTLYRHSAAL